MSAHARGFTLIELTMAIVVLSFGLLALAGALSRALHATAHARATHEIVREIDGIADSLAGARAFEAGSRTRDGVLLDWRPVACAPARCVRVTAATARDTISILAATRSAP